jgi:hypothetical protein
MRTSLPLLILLSASPLAAQMPQSDSARLVVTQDGRPVGTEDFAFRTAPGRDGEVVTSFVATTSGSTEPMRVAASVGQRRLTVRVAVGDREAAREYPGGPATLVADERVLSLFALAAGIPPGAVTVYGPPPNGRRPGNIERGSAALPGGGASRHVILRSGEDVVNIWYDGEGRLLRVEIPSRRLSGERVTGQ